MESCKGLHTNQARLKPKTFCYRVMNGVTTSDNLSDCMSGTYFPSGPSPGQPYAATWRTEASLTPRRRSGRKRMSACMDAHASSVVTSSASSGSFAKAVACRLGARRGGRRQDTALFRTENRAHAHQLVCVRACVAGSFHYKRMAGHEVDVL